MSGRQARQQSAVRDGFIAAYLAQGSEGGTARDPRLRHGRARRDRRLRAGGAQRRRFRGRAAAERGTRGRTRRLGVACGATGLALNWADEHVQLPPNIYQVRARTRGRGREAARRAWRDGHTAGARARARQRTRGGAWCSAFIDRLPGRGRRSAGLAAFEPRDSRLLGGDHRPAALRTRAGPGTSASSSCSAETLEYEPRRRQDADFLFLAARPNEALLMRPQLRFHYAGDLPIYATSSLYDAVAATTPNSTT
jgi:uncharacterized protein